MFKRILYFLLLFSSCTLNPSGVTDKNTFDWQGHRGCRGLLPENSIPAFLKALEFPVRTLELDVVISNDGEVIVSHDPYFSHHITTKPDGQAVSKEEEETLRLFDMSYDQIKTYDCGSRGNERFPEQKKMFVSKPSLADMVMAVEAYCNHNEHSKPFYNIEIKSLPKWYDTMVPRPAEFVQILVAELLALGIKKRTSIQSFDTAVLLELNKQAPDIDNVFLVENMEGFEANMAKLDFVPDIYSPYFQMVETSLVKAVHDKGMRLIPWTVNEVVDMKRMIRLGVDGIITDYPDRIAETLEK